MMLSRDAVSPHAWLAPHALHPTRTPTNNRRAHVPTHPPRTHTHTHTHTRPPLHPHTHPPTPTHTYAVPNTTEQYARGALIILSMLAGTIPNMVQDNMGALLANGLGQRGRDDPLLAKYACLTLRVYGRDLCARNCTLSTARSEERRVVISPNSIAHLQAVPSFFFCR